MIGGEIAKSLHDTYKVIAINRRKSKGAPEIEQRIVPELHDESILDCKFPDSPTFIHAAAAINEHDLDKYWTANVEVTRKLLELARISKAKHFIFISTGGVYGYRKKHFFSEDSRLTPFGVYGHTKRIGEDLVKMYCDQYAIPCTILRLYFPFSLFQKKGLFTFIKNSIMEEKEMILNIDGAPKIQPLHCNDIISALHKLLAKEPSGLKVYNLCGDEILSFQEIVDIYSQALNKNAKCIQGDNDIGDMLSDNSLIKKDLDWSPCHKVKDFIYEHALNTNQNKSINV